jgi:hypothetical protein
MRTLALERFGPGVDAVMGPPARVRSALLREGRYDVLATLAEEWELLNAQANLEAVSRDGDSFALDLDVGALLGARDLVFDRDGDRLSWRLPTAIDGIDDVDLTVNPAEPPATADVVIRHRGDGSFFFLPIDEDVVEEPADGGVRLRAHARATLIGATAALGAPLHRGKWDAIGYLHVPGWGGSVLIGAVGSAGFADLPRSISVDRPRIVVAPYWTVHDNLSFDVKRPLRTNPEKRQTRRRLRRIRRAAVRRVSKRTS